MKQVELTIDGKKVSVPEGTTVLEAAKKLNKVIPTFCYHPKLPVFGGCRMCLVYEKRWRTNIIACATPVQNGMEIETEHPKTLEERKFILEMLFTRHPLDCPVCDKAGECDLQNWGTYYGPQTNPSTITPFEKIRPEENWESDYFEFVSNRCVLCLRCVSVCKNVVGANTLFQEERGFEILIAPDKKPMDTESSCEACGLCVDICPVGAILFKPFKFRARPWLLKETITSCGMCGMQCPVAVDHDGNEIFRIRSTADLKICAGAYLGYDIHQKNRLTGAFEKGQPADINSVLEKISQIISEKPHETAVIASPYSSNETFRAIGELQEKTGIPVTSTITTTLMPVVDGFREEAGEYTQPSEEDILSASQIIVAGNDVAETNPVISYLFKRVYLEGNEVYPEKRVVYIGENLFHLRKLNPEVINKPIYELEENDFSVADKKTVIVYSTTTLKGEDAHRFGKLLGRVHRNTGAKVLLLPQETNAIGLLNSLEMVYMPEIIKQIKEGKIKNLIVFGEDIVDHIDEETLQEVFLKLENSCVITPFSDGLALSSTYALGCALWLEEDRTTEGFRGRISSVSPLKNHWTEERIIRQILDTVKIYPEAMREKPTDKTQYYNDGIFEYPLISLWDFGYLGRRSDNLMKYRLFRENRVEVADED
ncbi:2Fe-2S iron-sulfur cluster-binding protein [Persephonella sp.]